MDDVLDGDLNRQASDRRSGVRLAELIAALSLGTDLGLGQPMEHILRECLLALRLGERLELDESERAVLYYVALLAWVGCHVDAYEQARWFGDDIALKADVYGVDFAGARKTVFALRHLGAGERPLQRGRTALQFLASGGRQAIEGMHSTHCLVTSRLAERLGLGPQVRDALLQAFERWDAARNSIRWWSTVSARRRRTCCCPPTRRPRGMP
jgi:hypothetical protein